MEEAVDRALWRTLFGRGCGPAVRQSRVLMNENIGGLRSFVMLPA
jgi:hypothetical protein